MTARPLGPGSGPRRRAGACGLSFLLLAGLTVCAFPSPSPPSRWVKPGVNDAAAAREVADCRQQADAVRAQQRGIDQDISTTLGRNWQLGSTYGIESQHMNREAAGAADQTLQNCMLAKGFTRASR